MSAPHPADHRGSWTGVADPAGGPRSLTSLEARTLVALASDMAEDFSFPCAAVVVDRLGDPVVAERPPEVAGPLLDEALAQARATLSGAGAGSSVTAAVPLSSGGRVIGALGVSGGPAGFAAETARAAALALRLCA